MQSIVVLGALAAFASAQCGDSVQLGYTCDPEVSHYWGEYSPFFSVPSLIPPEVPWGCDITFANVLSRHGARFPTSGDTKDLVGLIAQIHKQTTSYSPQYEFIKNYNYTLGANLLTPFGQVEMVQSGEAFFERYESLARKYTPFFRSSSDERVIESAQNFSLGFHEARTQAGASDSSYPYPLLILSEDAGTNNTLFAQQICPVYANGPDSNINNAAEDTWANVWIGPVQTRVNDNLKGANLSSSQIIDLMELCPYNSILNGTISPFCGLFTDLEWKYFDYYRTVDKWYEDLQGNPLGPTTGVGWAAELIARMTDNRTYVTDAQSYTSINHTLDDSQSTFPLGSGYPLYADFTHDDNIFSIYGALGLYNATRDLSNTTYESAEEAGGFSSSWVVPFGGRGYFEKMSCVGEPEELVRVVINNRVLPLQNCEADLLGRCQLSRFVASQTFVTEGGLWNQCY